jgi:hypothetical protein
MEVEGTSQKRYGAPLLCTCHNCGSIVIGRGRIWNLCVIYINLTSIIFLFQKKVLRICVLVLEVEVTLF